jgi:hypothetical protein
MALAALVPSFDADPMSDAMAPVVTDDPIVQRHDTYAGAPAPHRRWVRGVRDLAENRLDIDALPWGTPIAVWTVDNDIIAFHVASDDGGSFAARIDDHGVQRWIFDDGTSLDGPMLARPVRYQAISSRIGVREHPIRHRTRFHAGTDYAAPVGTPIRAVANGVVTKAARNWTAGRFVVIAHDDGHETKYLHMDARAPGIEEGVRVRQGEVIGTVGKTGRVTGAHLHFEMRDRWRTPIDPSVARWPAASVVVDPRKLRAFALRQELLLTFRAGGSRDVLHPLIITRDGLWGHSAESDTSHAFLPPFGAVRRHGARARRTPLPARRRGRVILRSGNHR